ncbi:MAG TPA: hypothetical protein VF296_02675 [Gallionella sp.]
MSPYCSNDAKPFALSLPACRLPGAGGADKSKGRSWFDKLTTNGCL